jgi:uncharacterized protein (TIGR03437 family)
VAQVAVPTEPASRFSTVHCPQLLYLRLPQHRQPTTSSVGISIGGINALPSFAGLSSAGLYQINLVIPAGLGTGDFPLIATVAGARTQTGVVISLQ